MLQVVIPIVIVIGVIISLVYGYRRYKSGRKEQFEKYDVFVNFVLSLLAIFVGVFLAFQLSSLLIERTEKEALEAHIVRAVNELSDEIGFKKDLYSQLKEVDLKQAETILNKNEISDIISLNVILNEPATSKYFFTYGLIIFQGLSRDKEKTRYILNNPNEDIERRLEFLTIYQEQLEDLRDLLLIEKEYILGNLSENEANERMEKLHCVIPGKTRLIWK